MTTNVLSSSMKLAIGALCLGMFAAGCSTKSEPAPAPIGPVQSKPEAQKQPQPAPQSEPKPEAKAPKKSEPVAPPSEKPEPRKPAQPPVGTKPAPSAPIPDLTPDISVEVPAVEPVQPHEFATELSQPAREALKARVEALGQRYGFKIVVSQALSAKETIKGLKMIERAMPAVYAYNFSVPPKSGQRNRLEPIFDAMILGKTSQRSEEQYGSMRFRFAADQTELTNREELKRAVDWLKVAFISCDGDAKGEPGSVERLEGCNESYFRYQEVQEYRKARAELVAIRSRFPEFDVQCGTKGEGSTARCLIGARAFQTVVAEANPFALATMKHVVILDDGLMHYFNSPASVETDTNGVRSVKFIYTTMPSLVAHVINRTLADK